MRSNAFLLLAAFASLSAPVMGQPAKRTVGAAPVGNPADWFSPDAYPLDALRNGRAGRVVVEVGLDSTGKPVTCNVVQSSGTTSLDEGTCKLALERGKFDPATDRKGRPIASSFTLPVRREIPGTEDVPSIDLAKDGPSYASDIEILVAEDGKVVGCRSLLAKPEALQDQNCRQFEIGKAFGSRYTRNGAPVSARIIMRSSMQVIASP